EPGGGPRPRGSSSSPDGLTLPRGRHYSHPPRPATCLEVILDQPVPDLELAVLQPGIADETVLVPTNQTFLGQQSGPGIHHIHAGCGVAAGHMIHLTAVAVASQAVRRPSAEIGRAHV